MSWGVGVIGAGPGVSALHLPTLDRLSDRFRVVHVADAGSGRAAALAARSGAAASSGTADLLADPAVEVVAICSPPAEHARHALDAIAAGARGILCEKPLATTVDDARAIVDACQDAGIPLVVATNHLYDPAWSRAKHHLVSLRAEIRAISATVALPPNSRFHRAVTEVEPGVAPARGVPDLTVPEVAAGVVRQLVLGLAVHDLPAVRDLAPVFEGVDFAVPVTPLGYAIGFRASGIPVLLTAIMLPDGPDPAWRITVDAAIDRVDVEFPPAFVHTGSAEVRVRGGDLRTTAYPRDPEDGYVREWRALAELLDGSAVMEYHEILDDARFAIDLAEAASAAVHAGAAA
ncbi:Gfo/Idh/MocA family protein [Agromyces aurantiacus]|uniref:Gfo/Idh/MocA family protein n=1 Tax=Agromyces aurantiacus TaxID=165814 RepID=A0ABV9R7D2_9MICO|nr:Gfo/Idh/MocA family oxidoreductase [Agromyces aurantiacus]MBM7505216.1 putative dehydrogenase [Agromyces aurantiacus]